MGNFCVKQIAPFCTCHERYMYSVHLPFDSNEFSIRNITLKLAYRDNLIPQIFSYLKERKKYIPCLVSLPRKRS